MGDTNLNIKVSAEVAQAIKGFQSLENAIEQTEKDVESILSAIDRAETRGAVEEIKNLEAEFDAAVVKLKLLKDELHKPLAAPTLTSLADPLKEISIASLPALKSINELEDKIKELQQSLKNSTDFTQIKNLTADLNKAKLELSNFKVVGGFDDFGQKIKTIAPQTKVAVEGIKDIAPAAEQAGTKLLSLSQTLFSSLRKIAYVLPGIGVAGIFGLIGAGILEVVQASGLLEGTGYKSAAALKLAAAAAKEYKDTLSDAAKAVGDEAAKATTLVNALQSGTLNTDQRKKAIKELKDINVDYFGTLKDEKGVVEGLTQAYDGYIKQLLKLGEAKAIQGQLTKLFDKKLELELQIDPKFNASIDPAAQQELGKLKKQLQVLGGPVDVTLDTKRNLLDDISNKDLQKRIDLQTRINQVEQGNVYLKDKGYQQAQKAIDLVNLQIAGLSKLQQDNGVFDIKADTPAKVKDLSNIYDSLLEKIKRANDELDKPDKRPIFQQQREALLPDDFNGVSLLQQKISDGIAEGAKLGTQRAKDLAKELADLYQKQIDRIKFPKGIASIDFTLANPEDAVKASDKIASAVEKEFGKNLQLKIPIGFKIDLAESAFDEKDQKTLLDKAEKDVALNKPIIRFTPKIQAIVDAKTISDATLKEINKAVTTIEQGIAVSGLVNIGQALGDALSGNGFSKAIKGFESILGEGLIQIGKALITASTVIQGIKSALGTLFTDPVIGIVAGIGAIAIGEVLKNAVSNTGAHAFASGGIVTAPTLGLVGEAGPEVIFPLSQLNKFVKNTQGQGAQNINITGQISGNNLRLVLARSNKNQALV